MVCKWYCCEDVNALAQTACMASSNCTFFADFLSTVHIFFLINFFLAYYWLSPNESVGGGMIIGMGMLFVGGPHSMFEIGEFLAGTKLKKNS